MAVTETIVTFVGPALGPGVSETEAVPNSHHLAKGMNTLCSNSLNHEPVTNLCLLGRGFYSRCTCIYSCCKCTYVYSGRIPISKFIYHVRVV